MTYFLRNLTVLAVIGTLGIALSPLMSVPSSAAEMKELRIALLPNEAPDKELKKHATMTNHLEKILGMKVKVQVGIDYTAVIEALRNEHVDVAYLGPFSYVLADIATKGNVEPLVVGVRKKSGQSTYNSVIVARTNSGIKKVTDFGKKHTISFSDPASTSGFLVPSYRFAQLGIDPQKDFKQVIFAGGHVASLMALNSGKVDGAGTNLPTLEKSINKGIVDGKKIKIIWKSPDIPGSPLTVRKDIPWRIKYLLLKAFMGIPEGVDSYEGKMSGYEPAWDSEYDIIRDIKKKMADKLK
ncbi:MAG: phosphate/phosphite/phosphonate ABC transporter substrate-binding protein [Nitrospinaceae bacterium]|nr:phosphate/phosphite/phosphonate ABC transporter substrate-binding protein [Rhodospirillales bacterium]MEE1551308.1 phosphate/phosphite/phosphonate ABC transporter substrate-binding protein [Nitrospinaceae bacterium]